MSSQLMIKHSTIIATSPCRLGGDIPTASSYAALFVHLRLDVSMPLTRGRSPHRCCARAWARAALLRPLAWPLGDVLFCLALPPPEAGLESLEALCALSIAATGPASMPFPGQFQERATYNLA